MTGLTISQMVDNGEMFLDANDPGWWRPDIPGAVNLGTLDLASDDLCVLGQRCPMGGVLADSGRSPFEAQLTALTGIRATSMDRYEWAVEHGFMPGDHPWVDLTAEWRQRITRRRNEVMAR